MRIPPKIRIGPHPYNVRRVPAAVLKDKDGNHLFGDTDVDTLTIRLCKRMRKSKSQEVVTHEVLHGCCDGLDVPQKVEEKVVAKIAPALLQVLQDNPELVKYLVSK